MHQKAGLFHQTAPPQVEATPPHPHMNGLLVHMRLPISHISTTSTKPLHHHPAATRQFWQYCHVWHP
jgi:hypothetical protein